MKDKGNYVINNEIGKGSFGNVYICHHRITKKVYAIKVERSDLNMLKREAAIIRHLSNIKQVINMVHYGKEGNKLYMVMELHSLSLYEYVSTNKLSSIEKKLLGKQMLNIICDVHNEGIIHRDIKPENFILTMDFKQLILIDFGLATTIFDKENKHKPMRKTTQLIGSKHYVSIHSHNLYEPSRRDDVISLAYILLYIFTGKVPWYSLKDNGMIMHYKKSFMNENTRPTDLAELSTLRSIICLTYNIEYDEKPDYLLLESHINNIC